MSEPGNEPVRRSSRSSVYSYTDHDLNSLREFVDALYAVGAIGDERVWLKNWKIEVEVESDDLMPRPGQGPITMRHAEYVQLRATILALKISVAALAVMCFVGILIWIAS